MAFGERPDAVKSFVKKILVSGRNLLQGATDRPLTAISSLEPPASLPPGCAYCCLTGLQLHGASTYRDILSVDLRPMCGEKVTTTPKRDGRDSLNC